MGAVTSPQPVKLFAGLLAGDESLLHEARVVLEAEYGPADLVSPIWPFTASAYYRDELGEHPQRQFVFFETLIDVARLPAIKRRTNDIEHEVCDRHGRPRHQRPVNIDPGYMTLSKLVLATTKDYSHRLYLDGGIYAEVTLRYHDHRWHPWPWTYRDYAGDTYADFFERARSRLKQQIAGSSPA
jgi:hypothetical protein